LVVDDHVYHMAVEGIRKGGHQGWWAICIRKFILRKGVLGLCGNACTFAKVLIRSGTRLRRGLSTGTAVRSCKRARYRLRVVLVCLRGLR